LKVKTDVPGLDEMLNGGLLQGRAVLLSGSAGTGKTTLGMQFVYNGIKEHGSPGLFITLEQSREKIVEDMEKFGMDLSRLGDKFVMIGGPMAKIKYYQDKTKASPEDFISEIETVIRESGAERVVIDSVNLFLLLFDTNEERRKALLTLVETLSKLRCTALLTCEVKEGSFDLSWHGFEEFVVDGVITLYNVKQGPVFHQGLAIRKMRGMSHRKEIVPYKITDKGFVIYPDEPWLVADKKDGSE
jgi:circadian clock protein KaiC